VTRLSDVSLIRESYGDELSNRFSQAVVRQVVGTGMDKYLHFKAFHFGEIG
jgi:hypothetical protein